MFRQIHTIESVSKELVDGLEEGTIVLRPEDSIAIDIENFESEMRVILARHRRRIILMLCLIIPVTLVSALIGLALVLHPEGQAKPDGSPTRWAVMVLGGVVGAVMGFMFSYKLRASTAELETYLRVLELADESTARRLVLRVGPKLRERELVP